MSVKIIDTLKPKNNGSFPIVEAVDVAVTADIRLPEALAEKADVSALQETIEELANKAGIDDLEALSEQITTPFNFKGTVSSVLDLPSTAALNDTYFVEELNYRVTWNGSQFTQSSLDEGAYEDELSSVRTDLSQIVSTEVFKADTYIQNNVSIGDVVDLTQKPSSTHGSSLIIQVKENDVIKFSCWNAGQSAVSVGFLDEDHKLIYKSNDRFIDEVYIVPQNVAYVTLNNGMSTSEEHIESPYATVYVSSPNGEVINARSDYGTLGERLDAYGDDLSDVSEIVTSVTEDLTNVTDKLTQIISSESFTADTFIRNNVSVGDTVDITPSPSSSGVSSAVLSVQENDVLKFSCWNKGQSAVSVGFLDAEYRLISKSDSRFVDEDYIVPHNVAYVTLNNGMKTSEQHIDNPYANRYTAIPNGEVIAARSTYATLNERLDAIEIGGQKGTIRMRLDEREICEYYGLLSDGTEQETSDFSVTGFIDVIPNTVIKFKGLVLSSSADWGYCFYDDNKNWVYGESFELGVNQAPTNLTVTVPSNAHYFRTTFVSSNYEYRDQFYIDLDASEEKRPYQDGYKFFSAKVNQAVNAFWETSAETELDLDEELTTGVLALPESYTPNGKPTPIIMYFHGFSHGVWYGTWGATANFRTQKQHWLDKGFAVMDCNGGRNNNKTVHYTSGGSRQYVDGYKKCFEYVKKYYNVEDNVYIAAGSAGGIAGINYAFWYPEVKAMCLLSAWSDLYTCSWGQNVKDTIVDYLGFSNSNTYEPEKTIGFDPALRILNIGNKEYLPMLKVPTLALIGSTESDHVLYAALFRFINAARNAGNTATIRIIENATHTEVVSGGVQFIDDEVANWFKSN